MLGHHFIHLSFWTYLCVCVCVCNVISMYVTCQHSLTYISGGDFIEDRLDFFFFNPTPYKSFFLSNLHCELNQMTIERFTFITWSQQVDHEGSSFILCMRFSLVLIGVPLVAFVGTATTPRRQFHHCCRCHVFKI